MTESDSATGRREPGVPLQRLHAYWRMPYILAPKDSEDCENPFAGMKDRCDDDVTHVLFRGQFNYIILNRFPYNAGHLLVCPYREVGQLEDLEPDERHDHVDTVVKAQSILTAALQPEGFNIGYNFGHAGGAGIPRHLHCHVVPRWNGDTNFMPVIGNTRVIPESMDAMWKRLREFAD